jgi:3-oxoacyl-[acyl-carrier protein] reductase
LRDHADRVAAEAGRIDICFNLVGHGDVHGTPLIGMDVEDFFRPGDSIVRTTFLTSQAMARHMVREGGGVILIFGGESEPMRGTKEELDKDPDDRTAQGRRALARGARTPFISR